MRSNDTVRRRLSARRAGGRNPGTQLFQQEGEYWTIAYGGATLRLRDTKGLHCVARLLGRPGERIPARLLLSGSVEAGGEIIADERARVTITKRIKAALKRIQQHHPSLGHHLTTCIKTGHFCTYTPDPAQTVAWVLR